jgi:DNA-binding IclR family transcriptional regulator
LIDILRRFIIITDVSLSDKPAITKTGTGMRTVDKAFELLGFFTERRAQIGLSELARSAGFDKATTRRLLLALSRHGLVEQHPDDKRYRLGPGVLRLARVREATTPLASSAGPVLRRLVDGSGETAHLTVLAGHRLSTVAVEESHHSNRVTMEVGEDLPFHATASGLIVMAHADREQLAALKSDEMRAYTDKTHTSVAKLQELVRAARIEGFVINDGWYESDACSVAAPYFDQYAQVRGAVAVAAPSTRFSVEEQSTICALVTGAGAEMTSRIGGIEPSGKAA